MSTVASLPISAAAGGSFLIETRTPGEVFTPEDLTEEQRQFASTAAQFAREEILPAAAEIEAKKPGVLPALMRKAGDLGFTGIEVPEVAKALEVSEATYHRWRAQFGGMKADDVKRLKELERENQTLKRIVANKELEIEGLREIARGNW